mgnify:CR=1 FL=1
MKFGRACAQHLGLIPIPEPRGLFAGMSPPIKRDTLTQDLFAHEDADPDTYPTDGDDQVKLAIVLAGDARAAGYNAVASKVGYAANSVTGVLDVTEVLIGTSDPPAAATTIAISTRQRATWDTTRIEVVSSDGTP